MPLNEAFCQLTIEHVEAALAVDEAHGFPQDVFGLARLVMRTLAILASESGFAPGSIPKGAPGTDAAIDERIAEMMDVEQRKHGQTDDAAAIDQLSATRH